MITHMKRVVLHIEAEKQINRRFAAHFNLLEQELCFKLRHLRPICITNISYDVEVLSVSSTMGDVGYVCIISSTMGDLEHF